ncbi:MAG TPA: HAMP domain-containing sensor histidine kinase, partial [Cyclobacteriaceae bacterium]|nr:HAMP domain-containing sensor histidine kinase [Cyclobacteriaceae bacterium]
SILSHLKSFQLDKSKSIEITPTGINEFDDLNRTVSHLTERSTKVYLQQKEFIENASHELQTPLAIFQIKLDTLMQHAGLSEKEATTIMELEESVQRMTRLNKNLLLLSKIENEQFTDREPVPLAELIQSLMANLQAITDGLAIDLDLQPFTVNANRTLTEIMLTNLFHNAIRYTPPGGQISVRLAGNVLTVSNHGDALAISPEKIFERFQKGSGSSNGTGLGLAIVRKICDTCAYGLTYKYEKGAHIFSVHF